MDRIRPFATYNLLRVTLVMVNRPSAELHGCSSGHYSCLSMVRNLAKFNANSLKLLQ